MKNKNVMDRQRQCMLIGVFLLQQYIDTYISSVYTVNIFPFPFIHKRVTMFLYYPIKMKHMHIGNFDHANQLKGFNVYL